MARTIDIEEWAQSHKTCEQVAEAIAYLTFVYEYRNYNQFLAAMERIWQDPSEREVIAIWERATGNGSEDDTFMDWGQMTLAQVRIDLDI